MNKTAAFITGASGGLGKSCVQMALELDTDIVIATDLNQPQFEDDNVLTYRLDVREESQFQQIKKDLEGKGIRVKYLINNAGIYDAFAISESSQKLLDKSLKVNLYGPLLATSTFLDHLIETKGRVVQISSVSVKLPVLFMPYPNSKIALEAFSTSMRQELRIYGVELIIVRPGAMNTDLILGMKSLTNPIRDSIYQKEYDKFLSVSQKGVGKMVHPDKVACLIKKALTARKPKKIYSINKNRKIGIILLFPLWLRDQLIVKQVQ